ncbi:hypothetical protein ACFWZK_24110 [[Kitasatospora] papulosa]|uniref:hypothetical protein n=1 Tax=[Kitasatospora] papulosa TaxID=1464011 RepID=UPI0036AC97C5
MPPATDSYGTSAGGPTRDEPRTGRLRFLVGELGSEALRRTPWRWPKSIPQASKAQSAGTTTATSDAGADAKAGVPGLGEDGEQRVRWIALKAAVTVGSAPRRTVHRPDRAPWRCGGTTVGGSW